jgi:hypothetical protein
LSDKMIVRGLQRGYEDFIFLHSPLSNLIGSTDLTEILDKYWTKFALSFESAYLSRGIATWLGGFPPLPLPEPRSARYSAGKSGHTRLEDLCPDAMLTGIIDVSGPLALSPTPSAVISQALLRSLVNQVLESLPPVPDLEEVSSPKKKKDDSRKTSWATTAVSWVPGISSASGSGSGSGSASGSGPGSAPTVTDKSKTVKEERSRWSHLNLGLGSVGSAFGLGAKKPEAEITSKHDGPAKPLEAPAAARRQEEVETESNEPNDTSALSGSISQTGRRDQDHSHHVEQTKVDLNDLEAAVETDVGLNWHSTVVWMLEGEEYDERKLFWLTVSPWRLKRVFRRFIFPSDPSRTF